MSFSATARPPFSLLIPLSQAQQCRQKSKAHLLIPPHLSKSHSISAPLHRRQFPSSKSIDVSKEDKPISGTQQQNPQISEKEEQPISQDSDPSTPISNPPQNEPQKIDSRRLEEKFAVLNTGIYECRSCGFRYDEAAGEPSYPIPAGMEFEKLPEGWRCPTCGAAKGFFESKSVEIAGFAQNQQFGLGGNALTANQKALLIYGSLFFIFLLFLSGYFLQ